MPFDGELPIVEKASKTRKTILEKGGEGRKTCCLGDS
jgi:hypothetical protein